MRLSQIKLAGFKSFVDPTHIHLPGQIVGVVGPNGCGKSNVIDALRWVLGESKASALRGESMQDVIFNGSDKRKPVARASVELVFDNSLGRAAGQWASFAEISIKRVLLRNGDSSYLINNQKVRRRDITDIFLGTGLGARAYAIVEQGMISRIIEARPEELRVFLEEAAGVSRYRDRRRETALRLNDTRDNLLRVDDILLELDRQLAHLAGQAELARQYRALDAQRNTAQQLFWLVKKQEAETRRAGFAAQIGTMSTGLEAQTAALRESESRLETLRSSHYQLSDALHARQGELYSVNSDIAQLEQQIRHAALQQQRLSQQIAGLERQIGQQQQQRQHAAGQLAHWQHQQQEAAVSLLGAEQLAARETLRLPEAEAAATLAQQRYNGLQREQLQLQQQLQLAQTQSAHLQRNLQQMEVRRSRLQQERDRLPCPDADALHELQEELAELEMAHQAQQEQLADLQAQLPQADGVRQQLRAAMQQQERQLALTEARLHALQQLQRDSDQTLQGWLQQHHLDGLPRLWQLIRIDSGWEDALEAVLRERLNALAVPALGELALWHDAPPARVAVFEAGGAVRDAARHSGLNPLLDYVTCLDEQAFPAVSAWLASVFAVEDMKQADVLRALLPDGGWLVTRQGHIAGRHSVLFHAPDDRLHGVLARQREIEQLEQQARISNQLQDELKSRLDAAEQDYRLIEVQLPPLRSAAQGSQQRRHALQMQLLKLNQVQERTAERAAQITHEIGELEESSGSEQALRQDTIEQIAALGMEVSCFEVQLAEAQREANAGERVLREQRGCVEQAQHALHEAQFFARTCGEKIIDLCRSVEQSAEGLLQSGQHLQQLQNDLACSVDESAAQQLQQALQARQGAEQALGEARCSLENAALELQNLEQGRMSGEHALSQLRDQLHNLTLREQEARLYCEQWAEKLLGVDEQALLPQLETARADRLQNELNRLTRLIEALGAVNLAALDELQAATERKAYLDAQAQDLQQAMATLTDAIRHIDGESRALLMDTYTRVNQQLAELFPILFAGGEARLVLTGEEILDCGMQVMAQPPGKKNSSIHLLSGGEKALTAIALIFSLFQLNPAPFCLLDEVDAPLDDSNTERLCALVKKMAQHTQFVFISHNKIAMEMAEQLIGVTMQEKGVSRVVSVDIEAALRMRDEVAIA